MSDVWKTSDILFETMNNITKNITCLFFLLLWLIPMLPSVTFHFQQKAIQKKMQLKLQNKDLEQIVIAENDVIWVDEQEIWVNGRMFDFLSYEVTNGIYTFKGEFDHEETALIANHHSNQSPDKKYLGKIVSSFEFEAPMNQHERGFHADQSNILSSLNNVFVVDMFKAVPYPPPKC